jgi:hypothetical protein
MGRNKRHRRSVSLLHHLHDKPNYKYIISLIGREPKRRIKIDKQAKGKRLLDRI